MSRSLELGLLAEGRAYAGWRVRELRAAEAGADVTLAPPERAGSQR